MNWTYLNKDGQLIPRLFDDYSLQDALRLLAISGFDILLWADSKLTELDCGDQVRIRLSHRNSPNWSFECDVIWKDQESETEAGRVLTRIFLSPEIWR